MTSVSEARARLANSRRRTQVIQVAALQPGLSPDDKALLRNLERSQRAATVACRKALEYAESQERKSGRGDRREELKRGRERALELLKHPDPAVREPARRALDHAEVALGLLERMLRAKVKPPA